MRSDRLGGAGFQALFKERARRVESPSFVALWREGDGKVGFAVGRRVGGAVERNRGRRRLREAYRRRAPRPLGFDVVFVGRAAVLTRSFTELLEEMQHAMRAVVRAAGAGAPVGVGRKTGL